MLRIMTWNIERFGVNKFMTSWWDTTAQRQTYIVSTIQTAHPDVLVVIEVQTNAVAGFGGLLSDTSGGPAVQALLWHLRAAFPADNWSAVPPLILTPLGGYSEAVAVLYKATRLKFEGPLMWNGAAAVPLVPGGGVAYVGLWAGSLPNRPSVLGISEDALAGKYAFFDGATRLAFPGGNARSLWMTRFLDQTTNRTITLFALHFPPQLPSARAAFGQLARVAEITAPLPADEDRVIVGDFNINSNAPAQANVFAHLTGGPAVLPGVPVSPIVYTLQFPAQTTSLKHIWEASTTGPAPFYNYAGSSAGGVPLGLDNAFVARGAGAPGAANNQLVVNRVLGTPAPPAPAVYAVDMATDIPTIIANLPPGGARARRFRTLVNFGHVGGSPGASDHMAIVLELP
jgi:hypothetical protein